MIELWDFYAEWCPPCKAMAPVFEELKEEFAGKVEFKKINVDEQADKPAEFKVMSIPTFVIVKDGEEVDRKMGALGGDVLKSWINQHL